MVGGIRGSALLRGYRGAPPTNTASLIDLLHRVSRLASEHPEILELDLNPVVVFPGTRPCFALDARMRIARPGTPADGASKAREAVEAAPAEAVPAAAAATRR
jgi:acetyltransferase